MDGLILLLILAWICKSVFSPKSKAKKANVKGMKPDPEARKKAREAAAAHNEQLRRQLRMDDLFPPYRPAAAEEGNISSEGMGQTEVYRGSLNVETTEGECACDPSLEHARETYSDPDSVYATEISDASKLDFSPQGILQGVVMSEILARPSQRFRR